MQQRRPERPTGSDGNPWNIRVLSRLGSRVGYRWGDCGGSTRGAVQPHHTVPICSWLLPWGASISAVGLLAAIGLMLAIVGMAVPQVTNPVFLALTIVATPIGMAMGELAMLLICSGLFLPLGLVFRLFKRDALQLTIDRRSKTYWTAKKQAKGAASYYRQS